MKTEYIISIFIGLVTTAIWSLLGRLLPKLKDTSWKALSAWAARDRAMHLHAERDPNFRHELLLQAIFETVRGLVYMAVGGIFCASMSIFHLYDSLWKIAQFAVFAGMLLRGLYLFGHATTLYDAAQASRKARDRLFMAEF